MLIRMGKWFAPLADALFRPLCKSPEKGAKPALAAITSDLSGKYYIGNKVTDIPRRFYNPELDSRLWDVTMRVLFP